MSSETKVVAGMGAIDLIQRTAVAAKLPRVLEVPGEAPHVAHVVTTGEGLVEELELTPPPRRHQFETLGALTAFAANVEAGQHGENKKPVVWVDSCGVAVVVNDETRRDVGLLSLPRTPQFDKLHSGATADSRSQAEFIRLLRIDLAGTLPGDLLDRVRHVKWSSGTKADAKLQPGDESMALSMAASFQGIQSIPEEVTLHVRVYAVPDIELRQPVACAIDILPASQELRLVPYPMACADAIAATVQEIANQVAEGVSCPVYRGDPSEVVPGR